MVLQMYNACMSKEFYSRYGQLLASIIPSDKARELVRRVADQSIDFSEAVRLYAPEMIDALETILSPAGKVEMFDKSAIAVGQKSYGQHNFDPDLQQFDIYWALARLIELDGDGGNTEFCCCCYRVASREHGSRGDYCIKHAHTRKKPNLAIYTRARRSLPAFTARLSEMMSSRRGGLNGLNSAQECMAAIDRQLQMLRDNPAITESPLANELVKALESRCGMLSTELLAQENEAKFRSNDPQFPTTAWAAAAIYLTAQYQLAWERGNKSGSSAVKALLHHAACPPYLKDQDIININLIDNIDGKKDYPSTSALAGRWRKLYDDATGADHVDHGGTVTPVNLVSQWMRYAAWKESGDGLTSDHTPNTKRGRPSRIDATEAIRMVTIENKTVDEVAKHFGVTAMAVYALLHRRGIKLAKSSP